MLPSSAQFKFVLVGQDIGIQHASLGLGWVLAYKTDERESLRTDQGMMQAILRDSQANILIIVVPIVRRVNNLT